MVHRTKYKKLMNAAPDGSQEQSVYNYLQLAAKVCIAACSKLCAHNTNRCWPTEHTEWQVGVVTQLVQK